MTAYVKKTQVSYEFDLEPSCMTERAGFKLEVNAIRIEIYEEDGEQWIDMDTWGHQLTATGERDGRRKYGKVYVNHDWRIAKLIDLAQQFDLPDILEALEQHEMERHRQ